MTQPQSHVFYSAGWGKSYLTAERGEGVYLYDSNGKRYLDGIGGTHVNSIGHGVPEIAEAMAHQSNKIGFVHKANFTTEPLERLADVVAAMAPAEMDRVAFVTSGSNANEVALQIAQYYQKAKGNPNKYKIIGRLHSYHGRTVAGVSMSGSLFVGRDNSPYTLDVPHINPPHCYQCPFQLTHPSCQLACADDLATVIEREGPDTIAAFIAEPIVGGAGSAIVPPEGYYEKIRQICDAYDILFISEEVITGFGRTGKNFGIQHWNVTPDIITSTKGLSSGYAPIGAVILHNRIWETFQQSQMKSVPISYTYAGHPISCAAALAVQDYLAKHNLVDQCAQRGQYLKKQIEALAQDIPLIGDVRGKGLLIGIEFVHDRATHQPFPRSMKLTEKIVQTALDKGLVIRGRFGTGLGVDGDHILISPPFIISERECDELVDILGSSIKKVSHSLDLSTLAIPVAS